MTKAKIQKTVAILVAMCLAFVLMSVTMMNSAKAAGLEIIGKDYTMEVSSPEITAVPDKEFWYVAASDSYENIPDFAVTIAYTNNNGTSEGKSITDLVKVYSDSDLTKEVSVPTNLFTDTVLTAATAQFALATSQLSLENGKTYYLKLDKALTANGENTGSDVVIQFSVPGTKTTSSTTSSTTTTTKPTTTRTVKTTARTLTTRTVRTISTTKVGVRAKAANTGDESNMPLWVALAILAAGGTAIAYVWKEQE